MARQRNKEVIPKFDIKESGLLFFTIYHSDLAPEGRTTGRMKKSTGVHLDLFLWDKKKAKLIDRAGRKEEYNKYKEIIDKWTNYTNQVFSHFAINKITATKDRINEYYDKLQKNHSLNTSLTQAKSLLNFFKDWLEDETRHFYGKGIPYKKASITNKKQAYTVLKAFIDKKYEVDFKNISLQFHSDFLKFMRAEYGYSDNQMGKVVKELKFILKEAEINEYTVPQVYKSKKFYATNEAASDEDAIAISIEDILTIYRLNLPVEKEIYKDWFVLGCFTGLRVSDLLPLNITNIVQLNGVDWIKKKTLKTGEEVFIKISPMIRSVLDKYRGFPPLITEQKLNKHIKSIFGIAEFGYSKKVKTHCMRRSFATNAYKSMAVPNVEKIMSITGHRSLQNFLKYIRISPKEHAMLLQETAFFDDVTPLKITKTAS